ncbi:hypothetical protein QQF64_011547 [Cirrhinus molitorella]|uniref:Uncharacterized protein n=1 Tax=Cirrhinus molitorella TaxID=172907 RepID=A0ABR3M3S2_9TELE
METWEEAQEEDGYPGGGRKTESREETRGIRSRRKSQVGPRPQPRWRPTVEPTEGGAMEEEWPPTPGGRPTAAEQVEEEPEAETESRWRARATGRIRRAKAEQVALATDAETGIQKAAVEPERSRTEEEPEGGRSLTELEGWRDEAQPEEGSPKAADGRRQTTAEPEG